MAFNLQERDPDNKESEELVVPDHHTIFVERVHGSLPIISKEQRKSNTRKSVSALIPTIPKVLRRRLRNFGLPDHNIKGQ